VIPGQYVLSLPYVLRFKLAYSADATSVLGGNLRKNGLGIGR
jgi:hypothetical protein